MMQALLIAGLLIGFPKTETVWSNPFLNLSLTHADSWQVTEGKNSTKILIPIPNSEEKATVEIFAIDFRADRDIWQTSQLDVNKQMKREVLKQWEEETLGVPLLLTKSTGPSKGGATTVSLSGLIYSATSRKMLFRLSSSPGAFDSAEFEWRSGLQTLRTIDGKLPAPETPDRAPEQIPIGNEKVPKSSGHHEKERPPKTTKIDGPKTDKAATVVKGEVSTDQMIGGKKFLLRTPAGWTLKPGEETIEISQPESKCTATLQVMTLEKAGTPGRALFRANGASLAKFANVVKREDFGPTKSKSGQDIAWTWRKGTSASGPLITSEAVGLADGAVWLLTFETSDVTGYPKLRAALDQLIQVISLEQAP